MKKHYINKLLLGALAIGALSACTDDSMLPYDAGSMPESLVQYRCRKASSSMNT